MPESRPIQAWGIARFALARLIALGARGTPSESVAQAGPCEAARLCASCARLLRARTEGDLVLLMHLSSTKPLSLLLADDHTLIGDALAHVFATAGYRIERVFDGAAARDRVLADVAGFDTLIADHQQQSLGGPELVESLRRLGFKGRIIVFSSDLSDADTARYRSMQAEAVVVDQSDAARLLGIVKTLHGEK